MEKKVKLIRGSIWYVNLDPTTGREQAGLRPCLVLSTNAYNLSPLELVAVVPLTSKFKPFRWFVEVNPSEGGLSMKSYIITDQIRNLSIKRFVNFSGLINEDTLNKVEERLRILLEL